MGAALPLARFLGALLFLAGVYLSATCAPRFTWGNAGLRIDYPQAAAGWAIAAALAAQLLSLGLARGLRLAAAGVSVLLLADTAQLARYRVAIEDPGITERWLLGTKTLLWRDVARVESGSRLVVVWGRAEEQVRIDASGFPAEDRARLDRTIARRVRESAPARR